jgi:hypothetical protein
MPDPDSMQHKLLAVLRSSNHFPVVDHGNLHWRMDEQIIVFDTEAESFRWMRCPARLTYNLKLFSLVEGRLALSGTSPYTYTEIDVWVMQDYEAQT